VKFVANSTGGRKREAAAPTTSTSRIRDKKNLAKACPEGEGKGTKKTKMKISLKQHLGRRRREMPIDVRLKRRKGGEKTGPSPLVEGGKKDRGNFLPQGDHFHNLWRKGEKGKRTFV